jgi:4a-hydroxytetrahydrobiopterin dehydratase
MADLLSDIDRDIHLAELAGWRYDGEAKAIRRDFKFHDFAEAFAFMTRAAFAAEKAGHHPDWSNAYNRVSISLSTHDAGGVTEKDIALAKKIDGFAG